MTSNDHNQSPPDPHSQSLSPKQEPNLDNITTPPHNESNTFYINHNYHLPNFDFTRNRFAKSLKYQSPHSGCPNKECCSPSFFLDFANVKPILSPLSSDTVPSQVGSTYTEKHLAFARTHDNSRPPISCFDTTLTGIDTSNEHKISSPEEDSVIVCKFETVEEENKAEEEIRHGQQKVRDHPMKTRGRKKKDMEAKKMKEAAVKEQKNEKLKEGRKTRRKTREMRNAEMNDEEEVYKPEEAVKVLDAFIEKLNKKLSQSEIVKEEAMMEEEKPGDYGIQICSNNFSFESDDEEKNELLTEEESINVLRKTCRQRKPSVQFLSRRSDFGEISDTVLIDETGLRQNGGKGLRFFKADERTSGRILSVPEHMDDVPANLSKKISKLTKEETYQCRYCGKQFQKGCALGGHISRIHKGESLNFKMRQETRKKRVADRTRGKFLRKESIKQLESKEVL